MEEQVKQEDMLTEVPDFQSLETFLFEICGCIELSKHQEEMLFVQMESKLLEVSVKWANLGAIMSKLYADYSRSFKYRRYPSDSIEFKTAVCTYMNMTSCLFRASSIQKEIQCLCMELGEIQNKLQA